MSTAEVVRITESFRNETEYTVWSTLIGNLEHVSLLLQERRGPKAELDAFDRFTQKLLEPIGEKLGWFTQPGESTPLVELNSNSHILHRYYTRCRRTRTYS